MNKSFLKNNFFIIIFSISFFLFMIYMGVNYMISNEKYVRTSGNEEYKEENIEDETNGSEILTSENSVIENIKSDGENNTSQTGSDIKVTKKTEQNEEVFTQADKNYLDGALFIGDSRTDTLASYAGWTKTKFWVKTGMTIWDVLDEKLVKVKGEKVSVKKALKEKQYEKIYIMLGVNELGTGSSTDFYNQYKKVIDYLKSTQPDSVIYIQGIIHVTNEKRPNSSYVNNKNINLRNSKIIKLADNKQVFWLNLNEIFDKKGKDELDKKYTSDGIHIMPKYIPIWQEYLLKHVAKK